MREPTKKKNAKRAAAVLQRADHRPSVVAPQEANRRFRKLDHDTRIDKYRDRIFGLLAHCDLSPDMFDRLDQESLRDLEGLSDNTQVALMSDFAGYLEHVMAVADEQTLAIKPFPVTDAALDLYLNAMIGEGYKWTTVSRHMNSLRTWHRWADLADPTATRAIKPRLRKIRNSGAGHVTQKKPLQMTHLVQAVELHNPEVLRDVADLALLYTGFETGCRRSELVAFDWSDLQIDNNDGSGLLFLEKSKTDQGRDGAYLYLSPVTVAMLDYWQVRCGRSEGRIFRAIFSDGTLAASLALRGVAMAFKRIARKLGLVEFDFAGHSTRIGGAVEQMENGIELAQIMQSGRWQSPAMVMRYTAQARASKAGMAQLTRNDPAWTPENILGRRSPARLPPVEPVAEPRPAIVRRPEKPDPESS